MSKKKIEVWIWGARRIIWVESDRPIPDQIREVFPTLEPWAPVKWCDA